MNFEGKQTNEGDSKHVHAVKSTDSSAKIEMEDPQMLMSMMSARTIEMLKDLLEKVQHSLKDVEDFREVVSDKLKTLVKSSEQLQDSEAMKQAQSARDSETPWPVGSWKNNETGVMMMHMGQDIWIPNDKYCEIAVQSTSNEMFVRRMALAISSSDPAAFGMNNAENGEINLAADPTKGIALREIFAHYLRNYHLWSDAQIRRELVKVQDYLEGNPSRKENMPAKKNNCLSKKNSQKAKMDKTKRKEKANTQKNIMRKIIRSCDISTVSSSANLRSRKSESDGSSVTPIKRSSNGANLKMYFWRV